MNIYVANIPFETPEDDLRLLFEQFGTVDRVSMPTDRDTGRPRGFAFVEMSNDADAQQAIEKLDNTNLGGRQIAVQKARPKPARR